MHAVLGVDLEARRALVVTHDLVDPGRAIALRRFGIVRQIDRDRHMRVRELQVDRLVLFVIGA